MNKITVFENISETKNPYYIFVEHALDRIKNGKSKNLINKIRELKIKSEQNKLKMQLPSVCFSGTFEKRSKKDIIKHSGIICLDFDNIDIEERKEQLSTDPYIFSCWISPRGKGIKALIKIPANIEKHELYFDALKQKYHDIDMSGRDVSRVCYESYDPDIYINQTSKVFDTIIEKESFEISQKKPQLPLTDEGEIIKRIEKWLQNRGVYFIKDESRNVYINKLAAAFNRYGLSEYTAINYCLQYEEDGFNKAEIKRTVKSAYKNRNEHGISYFEKTDIKKNIRRSIRSGISNFNIADKLTKEENISNHEALKIIEEEKEKLNQKKEIFWIVEFNAKGNISKIELNRKNFIEWLHQNGFYRYKIATNYYTYIHIYDNVVEEINISDIRYFVLDWINKMEDQPFDGIDKHILYEFMAKGIKTFFSKELFDLLQCEDLQINTDKSEISYFYYLNGAVQITKNGVELINYCDLSGKVWKDQIIQRHIVIENDIHNNSYSKFIEQITDSPDNAYSLMSIIGYLLHRYKDKKISKAIVINDKQVSDHPEGGSGKGLIMEGIKQIRNVVTLDGKSFSPDKSFAFQRVELDTEILFIDDATKRFDFENLFSLITEGVTVEKKNKGEFFISFEKSPKLVIATNYYLRGEGASNDRRKVDIEINNYFNAKYTPFDEFGHTLFADWNNNEWNDFDNSMINLCQLYLTEGIIKSDSQTMLDKKLISNTSPEFVEWAERLKFNIEIERKELLQEFTSLYTNYNKLSVKKFMGWISSYCDYKNYKFIKDYRRSGNNFYIYIQNGTI